MRGRCSRAMTRAGRADARLWRMRQRPPSQSFPRKLRGERSQPRARRPVPRLGGLPRRAWVWFGRLRRMPRLPSPPAPLPQAGEGRIRSRFGRCGVRAGEAPSGTRPRPESGLSAFPAAGSPALARGGGAFSGSAALDQCVADPSSLLSSAYGQVRLGRFLGMTDALRQVWRRVQVKPRAVGEAFRGCCGGFTRSREIG